VPGLQYKPLALDRISTAWPVALCGCCRKTGRLVTSGDRAAPLLRRNLDTYSFCSNSVVSAKFPAAGYAAALLPRVEAVKSKYHFLTAMRLGYRPVLAEIRTSFWLRLTSADLGLREGGVTSRHRLCCLFSIFALRLSEVTYKLSLWWKASR